MVKTLLKSVRQYKRVSIETPLFVTMEVILECTIPLIMSKLIDDMTRNFHGTDLKIRRPLTGPCDPFPALRRSLGESGCYSRVRTRKELKKRSLL